MDKVLEHTPVSASTNMQQIYGISDDPISLFPSVLLIGWLSVAI